MKKTRMVSNIIGIILIAVYVIFLLFMWERIPDVVPTHFNAAGIADNYGSKSSIIVIAVVMIAVFALLAIVERFPGAWNFPVKVTDENRERLLQLGMSMLAGIKILLVCLFIDAGLSCIYGKFPVWVLYMLLAAVFLVIAAGIIKCFQAR